MITCSALMRFVCYFLRCVRAVPCSVLWSYKRCALAVYVHHVGWILLWVCGADIEASDKHKLQHTVHVLHDMRCCSLCKNERVCRHRTDLGQHPHTHTRPMPDNTVARHCVRHLSHVNISLGRLNKGSARFLFIRG